MPELKHNFLKGRMNKDLDERLVPDGEYRDALNIEINTSEDSDAGTAQTTMGNINLSLLPTYNRTKCVGSVTDEKNDKIYWLISESSNLPPSLNSTNTQLEYGDFYLADLIVEYDYKTGVVSPVVVDTFYTTCNISGINAEEGPNNIGRWISLDSFAWSGNMDYVVYPGMEIEVYDTLGNSLFPPDTIVEQINVTQWQIKVSNTPLAPIIPPYNNYYIKFQSYNRPLNFNNDSFVTGINIIDDMLFWTDNHSEPKKINISKCKRERDPNSNLNPYLDINNLFSTHSMLVITDTTSLSPDTLKPIESGKFGELTPLKEEHVTIIKRSPILPLNLEMKNNTRDAKVAGELNYINFDSPFFNQQGKMKDTTWIEFGGPSSMINTLLTVEAARLNAPTFRIGDIVMITAQNTSPPETIRARVIAGIDPYYGSYELDILSFSEAFSSDELRFDVELEQPSPLFEFKFPRFAYRYKYEDGEYSAFSTFTEIAFLPEKFKYLTHQGYNLGMTNNVRHLVVKGFVDSKTMPLDVLSIDILYKESGSPNIYSVKTIERDDFEWNAINNEIEIDSGTRGYLKIESEMIYATLPSNQLLRPWDNVPRKALAQEITGNRLVYGNYLQNYNLENLNLQIPNIKINLALTLRSDDVGVTAQGWSQDSFQYDPEEIYSYGSYKYNPSKSIKSLRTYQLGVIYRDKYGRETPVFSTTSKAGPHQTDTASLYIEKLYANKQNKLRAQVKNPPPSWAESFKFFIKETSNEYYNLSMDRWYDAADDNVWLSFPSSERNKVDEDTFLILKKEKDNDNFVEETARYKILAIENEAPTYVKTTKASMGGITDEANGYTGSTFRDASGNSTGLPRSGVNYMYVEKAAFDNIGWFDSIVKSGIVGLKLRMSGGGSISDWYRIESVTAAGAYYRIDIIENEFGEDMNLTHRDSSSTSQIASTVVAGLRLEITRDVIENKPEFDGRFFVKIYRDNVIYDRIIKPSIDATKYVVNYSRGVNYIDAIKRGNGIASGNTWSETYWGDTSSSSTGTSTIASGALSDQIHDERGPQNDNFWGERSGWFIDATEIWEYIEGAPWKSGGDHGYAPVYLPGYREKGFGINNSGWEMHLSFTKIGGGTESESMSGWSSLWDMDNHDGSNTAKQWANHTAEISFINKLTTPGTLFRWRQDPDQHIYKVGSGGEKIVGVNFATPRASITGSVGSTVGGATSGVGGVVTTTPGGPFGSGIGSGSGSVGSLIIPGGAGYPPGSSGSVNPFNITTPHIKGHIHDHWFNYAHKNRYTIYFSRLSDGGYMGAPSEYDPDNNKYNAQYRPDNPVNLPPWYNTAGLPLPSLGTCDDGGTSKPEFENDSKGCIAADYTWSQTPYTQSGSSAVFNTSAYDGSGSYSAAPGLRSDGGVGPIGNPVTYPSHKIKSVAEPSNPQDPGPSGRAHEAHPNIVDLEILDPIVHTDLQSASTNPAMWETEPKEDIGLDIYHEIGQTYPIEINDDTNEQYIPIGSTVTCWRSTNSDWYTDPNNFHACWDGNGQYVDCSQLQQGFTAVGGVGGGGTSSPASTPHGTIPLAGGTTWTQPIMVKSINDNIITLVDGAGNDFNHNPNWPNEHIMPNDHLGFVRPDGSRTTAIVSYDSTGIENGTTAGKAEYRLERIVCNEVMTIPWFNCYSFGNGVESDRIRDDFNQLTIGNGPKASTTLEEPYLEERRGSGFIWSGIYNSTSGINNLNQFIQAEKITKDLNPVYGSIQKLHTRDTNLVTLCEDKCFNILAHKDALYKADGNPQVVSTDKFLGQTTPFKGEFGISKNPESFASESFRAYFTDKQRGAVLRLSQDGLTPISNVGMKDWFADNLVLADTMVGSVDDKKSTYNLTLNKENPTTVSFSEISKGWTSFKSFIQESGVSLNNHYYTFKKGDIWRHHEDSVERNSFYNNAFGMKNYDSSITLLLNENPGSVKSFGTLNYEGSQPNITQLLHPLDLEYYDNVGQTGWYVDNIKTNLQEGNQLEFKGKENKWFSQIKGVATELSNVDTEEFSVQGIDITSNVIIPEVLGGCMECGYIWEQQTGLYCNGTSPSSQKVPGALNYNPNATKQSLCEQCVFGCMVGSSTHPKINSNYDPGATCDDGSCIPCIYGCTNNGSPNYNGEATCDDGSCIGVVNGCTDPTACNYSSLATFDDGSCLTKYGCMDPTATNYTEGAMCDDGSCVYCIYGCTDSEATNYNSLATCNNYTCIYPTAPSYTYGCMDPEAYNYSPSATIDDGSCIAVVYGCTNLTATNYNPLANTDDGSCIAVIYGCMNPEATNYNPLANTDDGSCVYGVAGISGCMDRTAANYNPNATIDDESCVYDKPSKTIYGCTNPKATNYNPAATIDDGSCVVPTPTPIYGCLDNTQFNHAPSANAPCEGPLGCLPPNCNGPWSGSGGGCCVPIVHGCIDPNAGNFNPLANVDDGSCCTTPGLMAHSITSNSMVIQWMGAYGGPHAFGNAATQSFTITNATTSEVVQQNTWPATPSTLITGLPSNTTFNMELHINCSSPICDGCSGNKMNITFITLDE